MGRLRFFVPFVVAALASCEVANEHAPAPPAASASATGSASAAPVTPLAASGSSATVEPALVRSGATIAYAFGRLVLADEPTKSLRLPESGTTVPLPGRPAQLLRVGDVLYVTVRDAKEGGLVLELGLEGDALVTRRRVVVADDAWGLASSQDGKTLLVTSAWTHRVSAVDAASMTVRWSLDVGREPRGVVVTDAGVAYVSHLTSAAIDRIEGIGTPKPTRKTLDLPPAPLRAKDDAEASLGYTLALSDDGTRLFAPRHALGAFGRDAWFGVATVDVLALPSDAPLVPRTHLASVAAVPDAMSDDRLNGDRGTVAIGALAPFTQPRGVLYQKGTESLFVLGEGDARIVELDAEALDPSIVVRHTVELGDGCFGPSGMALAKTEIVVQCAASFTWMRVPLPLGSGKNELRTYADDPLPAAAAAGRRQFVSSTNEIVSGGLGCAGCHPEGRDDGHVWHEIDTRTATIDLPFDVAETVFVSGVHVAGTDGRARQTPMLAGRVEAPGPYGWKAESKTLDDRIFAGTHLHRWRQGPFDDDAAKAIAEQIAAFLRQGLVLPRGLGRALTEEEKLGKSLFERRDVGCAMCHGDGGDGYAHRLTPWHTRAGFVDEATGFKTPNLRFVSHTAPYFHDGSARTLDDLIDDNDDRMGKTNQLEPNEKKALVAYLRTL